MKVTDDTLTVVGTEFGDDFVVNEKGVFGAGLFVTYAAIEKLVVDAQEGNDTFFIVSTHCVYWLTSRCW